MTRRASLFALLALLPAVSFAQQSAASPIDGVWKITEIVYTGGAKPETIANPQPSQVMFSRGYYSWIIVNGTTPRKAAAAPAVPGKLTDAEKIARFEEWNEFAANAGTYEIKGSTLTRRPVVAKGVNVMTTNPPGAQQFTLEGNTLTLSGPTANDPKIQVRFRLTRVP